VRSDTATLPYPTQQVIATPNFNRKRGDWGLKRPLPLKSTVNSSGVQINELDTHDQITDFAPASNYEKALAKLQELNLNITRPGVKKETRRFESPRPSAFEPGFDHTSQVADKSKTQDEDLSGYGLSKRWTRRGPNLKDMCDSEFQEYLENKVRQRGDEFMAILRKTAAREFVVKMSHKSQHDMLEVDKLFYLWLSNLSDQGLQAFVQYRTTDSSSSSLDLSAEKFPTFKSYLDDYINTTGRIPAVHQSQRTESQGEVQEGTQDEAITHGSQLEHKVAEKWDKYWQFFLANFRNNSGTDSTTRKAIVEFLDLPSSAMATEMSMNSQPQTDFTTHPSAGLSYHRTHAVLDNHPIYGPLKASIPRQGRVLLGRGSPVGGSYRNNQKSGENRVGLAGVAVGVADFGASTIQNPITGNAAKGGEKRWLVVSQAEIEPKGRLCVTVRRANDAAIAVATDEMFEVMRREQRKQILNIPTIERAKPFDSWPGGNKPIGSLIEEDTEWTDKDDAFKH
jgi:Mitochondrial ribosomal protein subunit